MKTGLFFNRSAVEWIRTTTLLRAPAPQAGASASSATTAQDLPGTIRRCDRIATVPTLFELRRRFRKVSLSNDVVSREHRIGLVPRNALRYIPINAGTKQIAGRTASEVMQEKIRNTRRLRQLLPRCAEVLNWAPIGPCEYGVVRLFSFDTDAQKIINLLGHFNNAAFVVLGLARQ
jgi:hypothetical protein